LNEPRKESAEGFETSRMPRPKKLTPTYAVWPCSRNAQISSGKVWAPSFFGKAGFDTSKTVKVLPEATYASPFCSSTVSA
jgi:hypothetical protein